MNNSPSTTSINEDFDTEIESIEIETSNNNDSTLSSITGELLTQKDKRIQRLETTVFCMICIIAILLTTNICMFLIAHYNGKSYP